MKTITIIDDDSDLRNLLEVVLRYNNFAIQVFSSAEDFRKRPPSISSLFILDINLGGTTGVEICQALKRDAATEHVPVLMISAHPDLQNLSQEACADAFLQKPFSQTALMEKIRELLPEAPAKTGN